MLLLRGGIHELTGCRDIAILLNDIVLDTWHRYQGCKKPGIRFLSVEFQGADPISLVLSRNLYRTASEYLPARAGDCRVRRVKAGRAAAEIANLSYSAFDLTDADRRDRGLGRLTDVDPLPTSA